MSKYVTEEGKFFVELISPTKEDRDKYYENTGEIKLSDDSPDAPKQYQKAIIKHTYDETKYPVDSEWIVGETPGIKINFFGEKLIEIQSRDLHARIS